MSGLETFAVAAPLITLIVGSAIPALLQVSPARAAQLAYFGALGALAAAFLAILGEIISGPSDPVEAAGQAFRMDELSAMMLGTVAVIGAVVARFARRYLDRDPAQIRFSRWLSYTLAAILTIPIANHLGVLMVAWLMSSHGLHHLLTLYPERPGAQLAARKKFLVSRLGDGFLVVAFALIYVQWGSLDLSIIFERAAAASLAGETTAITWISFLIVLGAITKSAQVPFHTWLPDTMETPTPVSALMHAGIVNAGGFLVIRLSPVLSLAPTALGLLAYIGAFSAMVGGLVMLTQNDVKRKLAYSTVSQMGFMMLQCGLGAFSAAMLHLVGHSFYKAHGFLTAGSWVDTKASDAAPSATKDMTSLPVLVLSVIAGLALTALAIWILGVQISTKPGGGVLASVLAIALAQGLVIWSLVQGRRFFRPKNAAIALATGLTLAVSYFCALGLFDDVLGSSIARPLLGIANPSSLGGFLIVAMFLAAMLLQTLRPAVSNTAIGAHVYSLLRNGFYLGEIQNRWIQRVWPLTRPKSGKPVR